MADDQTKEPVLFSSGRDWSQLSTEQRNSFFQLISKQYNAPITEPSPEETTNGGGDKSPLRKQKSQSNLTSSTSSLVSVSETDMTLLSAQLGSVYTSLYISIFLSFQIQDFFFDFHFLFSMNREGESRDNLR